MNPAAPTRRRARVLLLAYACSPRRGSECALGWNRAVQTARFCDTWVICEEREHGDEIRQQLARFGPVEGLHFCFQAMNGHEHGLARLQATYYLAYNLWQRRAARLARQLHEKIGFDLVHHVNYCGFREPGYAWQLPIPFVWGPVGGTQNLPLQFLGELGPQRATLELTRNLINRCHLYGRRRVRSAFRRAAVVLAANTTNQQDISRAHGILPQTMVETGLATVVAAPRFRDRLQGGFRILWIGQCLAFKGLSLLFCALAELPDEVPFSLRVVGDGPRRRAWQRPAKRLGLQERVTWTGWLPHEETLQQYTWADAFVFSSLRDTTGTVMLEAMSNGLPIVCLDHQGGQDIATPDCGLKIPVTGPADVVRGLREAVRALSGDPQLRRRLAVGALARAGYFLWQRQGERMAEVYRRILQDRQDALHLDDRQAPCGSSRVAAAAIGPS